MSFYWPHIECIVVKNILLHFVLPLPPKIKLIFSTYILSIQMNKWVPEFGKGKNNHRLVELTNLVE